MGKKKSVKPAKTVVTTEEPVQETKKPLSTCYILQLTKVLEKANVIEFDGHKLVGYKLDKDGLPIPDKKFPFQGAIHNKMLFVLESKEIGKRKAFDENLAFGTHSGDTEAYVLPDSFMQHSFMR